MSEERDVQVVELEDEPGAWGAVARRLADAGVNIDFHYLATGTRVVIAVDGTIPPSGKQQVTPAALFFTFEGNKIKESHQYFDSMTLLEQIGALPK